MARCCCDIRYARVPDHVDRGGFDPRWRRRLDALSKDATPGFPDSINLRDGRAAWWRVYRIRCRDPSLLFRYGVLLVSVSLRTGPQRRRSSVEKGETGSQRWGKSTLGHGFQRCAADYL